MEDGNVAVDQQTHAHIRNEQPAGAQHPAEQPTFPSSNVTRLKPASERAADWSREHKGILIWTAVIAALTVGAFALHHSAKPAPMPMGPVPVTVQTLTAQTIRLWSEFPGRLEAVDYAEIRPEVSGRVTEVRFEDGQTVHKGDILYVIEPEPYAAALARAQSNADFAKTEVQRADKLVQSQAIAQRAFDERVNASKVAEAELVRAQIDYRHAYVVAPISGRVGRHEITVGNLVQSANAPLLTTIVSNKGIYADFQMDEQTYLESIRGRSDDEDDQDTADTNDRDTERTVPIELTLPGDSTHSYHGKIYSFDNHIDTISGTIRARAKFDNKDGRLLPGMFVTIKTGGNREVQTVLVPERAVGTDQDKRYVYTVSNDNKVVYREVVLGKAVGGNRVVLSGIGAGDRVIVEGTQHVRPDVVVDPRAAPAAPAPAAAPQQPVQQ